MKIFKTLSIIIGCLLLTSCIKHEVIPAPEPMVDLPASFSAQLNGSSYNLKKEENGYYSTATFTKVLNPLPQLSSVVYISALKSKQKSDFLKISLGKLLFNPGDDATPSLTEFTQFFQNNKAPNYKKDGDGGVEIVFRDAQGSVWYSDENSTELKEFQFTSLSQESDSKGDYMKFTAKFNVSLYDNLTNPTDTIVFQNAVYEGYFER